MSGLGGEKPVILDPGARKFWMKYVGRDKKVDIDFLWESISQEYDRLLSEADLISAEKNFMKAIDKNRNGKVTNIEFNSWTRQRGLDAMVKEVVDTSHNTWHDDEDGQWGDSEVSRKYEREDAYIKGKERDERARSREKRHDRVRDEQDRRRGRYDDSDDDRRRRRGYDDSEDDRRPRRPDSREDQRRSRYSEGHKRLECCV